MSLGLDSWLRKGKLAMGASTSYLISADALEILETRLHAQKRSASCQALLGQLKSKAAEQ